MLYNGLGRYESPLAAARQATDYPQDIGTSYLALGDLVEAASLTGTHEIVADAHRLLAEVTHPAERTGRLASKRVRMPN